MKIPGMDGIEILKHVKEIDESIKVILMTAYGELDMIQEAKDLGALMHFAKPFDIDEIRQAVRNELAVEHKMNFYKNMEKSVYMDYCAGEYG